MTSIYRTLLGSDFHRLPAAIRRMHENEGKVSYVGKVETMAPASLLATLLALLLGAPIRKSEGSIRFELDASPEREIWVRHFPARRMVSVQSLEDGLLVETIGAAKLFFRLTANEATTQHDARGHALSRHCLPALADAKHRRRRNAAWRTFLFQNRSACPLGWPGGRLSR